MGLGSLVSGGELFKEYNQTREDISDEELINNYVRVCRLVRKGCNFDIQKCFVDGKPLIIEGSHIEPNIYVKQVMNEDGSSKLLIHTPDPADEQEEKSENTAVQKMRKQMQAID